MEFKRSRLKREEEKKFVYRGILLGLISVGVLLSLLFFGLPVMIKLSVWLGEVRGKYNETIPERTLPPLAPRLIAEYEATNSAKLEIRGYAEKDTEVELLKNDVSLAKVRVDEAGEFRFENVELVDGENSFSAIARSEVNGSSEVSERMRVVLDREPPELDLTNPSETSLKVEVADFDIVGRVTRGSSVTVNGQLAMVDDQGVFKLKVQLSPGKNTFEVKARDLAGNEKSKSVEITYDF